MNKVLKYAIWVGVIATLALTSACTMRASKPPTAEPTATSELLFLLTPTSISDAVASQTAAVKSAVATATPEPQIVELATATPEQVGGGQTQPESGGESESEPVTIPTLARPSTYTLQKGEWPICIARRFDLNLSSFFSANGLTMDSRPGVGTVLQVPSSGNWDSSAHGPRTLHPHASYTVQAGDTVYSIACYFGDVSPEGILAANGLSSASDVTSGMTLKIP